MEGEIPREEVDRIIQYIVLRRDLVNEKGPGYMANQAAHASMAPIAEQLRQDREIRDQDTRDWFDGTFYKCTLGIKNQARLNRLIDTLSSEGITFSEIRESSLGGELTAIATKPYRKSEISKYFSSLQLLR